MFLFTLISVALVFRLAIALPHSPIASRSGPLPPHIRHIAHDERTGRYLAYRDDGTLDGMYETPKKPKPAPAKEKEASRCFPLSAPDAKSMGGWNKIEGYANKNWGTGKRQIAVNPVEYVDQNAMVCPADKVVEVEFVGGSNCIDTRLNTDGKLVGTSGMVLLTIIQGYRNTAGWVITRTSTLGAGLKVSTSFKIPGIADVGGEISTTVTLENSLASSFETTIDNTVSHEIRVSAAAGKRCSAEIITKSCNVMAKARLRQTASGWVWFMYDNPTGPGGHRKWAVKIDAVVNGNERSSYMEFSGSMKAQAQAKYGATCK